MNDKELLELAARAAGFPDGWVVQGWNPLADDGDALRLAVKLGLLVDCSHLLKKSEAMGQGRSKVVNHGADPLAATRRVITIAAAEIGRSM